MQEAYWKTALIGYVLGDTPFVKSMESYSATVWKGVKPPQVLAHNEGYFIFRFATQEDCDCILNGGPYAFHSKPFIVRAWELNFEFQPDCITIILLWLEPVMRRGVRGLRWMASEGREVGRISTGGK